MMHSHHQHHQPYPHPHPHHPANPKNNSLGEANRKFFDSAASAAIFDQDWIRALALQITNGLQSRIEWLGLAATTTAEADEPGAQNPPVRLLDYACGKGLVSEALHHLVTEIRGIDLSAGMVELYNQNAAQRLHLSPQQMRAIQGDLLESNGRAIIDTNDDEFRDFDLAVMCMALHHVPDPLAMLRALVQRLRPGGGGGKVVIIDWTLGGGAQDGDGGDDDATDDDEVKPQYSAEFPVAYQGFSRRQMTRLFREAGCSVTDYQVHPEPSLVPPANNAERYLFFAKGEFIA